jgi:3-dehydroquinate synthase
VPDGPDPLRHGEAVGLGMLAAARLGVALGAGDPTLEARLTALLPRLGLPIDLDRRLDRPTLARIGVDKKRLGAELALVLVDRIGSSLVRRVPVARVGELLLEAATK